MNVMIPILLVLVLSVFTVPSTAQEIPNPVETELVSNVITVKPGDSFKLGVLFKIDPGWYIYWKNPGDSGLPTEVDFTVPANFKAGELNWPAPSKFQNATAGTDFGYKKSILLWSDIKVPAKAKVNSVLTIQAEVSWLSCKEICIPGRAILKYNLHLSDSSTTANTDLFSKWQERLEK